MKLFGCCFLYYIRFLASASSHMFLFSTFVNLESFFLWYIYTYNVEPFILCKVVHSNNYFVKLWWIDRLDFNFCPLEGPSLICGCLHVWYFSALNYYIASINYLVDLELSCYLIIWFARTIATCCLDIWSWKTSI